MLSPVHYTELFAISQLKRFASLLQFVTGELRSQSLKSFSPLQTPPYQKFRVPGLTLETD